MLRNIIRQSARIMTVALLTYSMNGQCTTEPIPASDIRSGEETDFANNLTCFPPDAPTVSSASVEVCPGSTAILSAEAPLGELIWYSDPDGLEPVGYGPTFETPVITDVVQFYVAADDGGCLSDRTEVTVIPVSAPEILINADFTEVCQGELVTLEAIGADNVEWDNGVSNGNPFQPNETLEYTVVGTNDNGCSDTESITITVFEPQGISAMTSEDMVCEGSFITLSASGAESYIWEEDVENDVPFQIYETTTFHVIGIDANGCENYSEILIMVNPLPEVTLEASSTGVCPGESVTLSGIGASLYSWDNGVTDGEPFSPTESATYTVEGTDDFGCQGIATITVEVYELPLVTANAQETTICEGEFANLSGGGAVIYEWDNGVNDGEDFLPVETLEYTVTGTDLNGCQNTASITVVVNIPQGISAGTSENIVCSGDEVTLNAVGAESYIWEEGVENGVPFVIYETTTFHVIGTDALGCENSSEIEITVNPLPELIINASATEVCSGSEVTLEALGAEFYEWSNAINNGDSFEILETEEFTVIGFNEFGCLNTASVTISVVEALPISIIASDSEICVGDQITLTGNGAVSYIWSDGVVNGQSFAPGITDQYTVTGTDENGCEGSASITIVVHELPVVGISASDDAVCPGSSVTLSGTGATSYAWSGNITNGVPFLLASTNEFNVVGTDGNGCSNSASITITAFDLPEVSIITEPSASVCQNESVTLQGAGATSYQWSGNITDGVAFVPLQSGSYQVTGTDDNGCQNTASQFITVNELPEIQISVSPSNEICQGSLVTLNASGADTYDWENGIINGQAFSPESTEEYTVTAADANGCVNTASQTIIVNDLPEVTITFTPSLEVCANTAITLSGEGASSYAWTGNIQDGVAFFPLSGGTYTVAGTDGNGCENFASVDITVNDLPEVDANVLPDNEVCLGEDVTIQGTGATSYTWSEGYTDGETFAPEASLSLIVTGTDANGCQNLREIEINVNELPEVTILASSEGVCPGESVTLTAEGAESYIWSNGVNNGVSFIPVESANYAVTGTDENGCEGSTSIDIEVFELPEISLNEPQEVICIFIGSYDLSADPEGGFWAGAGVQDNVFLPGIAGEGVHTLSYQITTDDGCSVAETMEIEVGLCDAIVENDDPNAFSIYPNPHNGSFHVILENPGSVQMEVLDTAGRLIYQKQSVVANPGMPVNLELTASPGVYFMRIWGEKGPSVRRMTIQP